MSRAEYIVISEDEIPERVRFDVPQRNQGQIVEVAYGGHHRAEHDDGDLYKRITDRSDGSVTYYRRAGGAS